MISIHIGEVEEEFDMKKSVAGRVMVIGVREQLAPAMSQSASDGLDEAGSETHNHPDHIRNASGVGKEGENPRRARL